MAVTYYERLADWPGKQQKEPGRIREVTVAGKVWIEYEIRPTDTDVFNSGYNTRAETNLSNTDTGIKAGDRTYIAVSHLPYSGTVLSGEGYMYLQSHSPGSIGGQSQHALCTPGGDFAVRIWSAQSPDKKVGLIYLLDAAGQRIRASNGKLIHIVLDITWGTTNSTGRTTVWCNGVNCGTLNAANIYTIDPDDDRTAIPVSQQGASLKMGGYLTGTATSTIPETKIVRDRLYRIATTFADAVKDFPTDSGYTGATGGGGGTTPPPADTTAPTVGITSPSAGAELQGVEQVVVAASDAGGIARVELLVGGTVVATDTVAPYALDLPTSSYQNGPLVVTARATDLAGNVASSSRTFVVANAAASIDLSGPWPAVESFTVQLAEPIGPWSSEGAFVVSLSDLIGPWPDVESFVVAEPVPEPEPEVPPAPPPSWPAEREDWNVAVLDRLTGETRVTLAPASITFTRRLNRGGDGRLSVPLDGRSELLVKSGQLVRVMVSIDGAPAVVRFAGIVADHAIGRDANGNGALDITVPDPFAGAVERRHLQTPVPGPYAGVDQGAIFASLLAAQNAREATHLRMGSYVTTVARDRTYEHGKNAGEALRQLAAVIGGAYFTIDPLATIPDGTTDVAEVRLRWPEPGTYRAAAQLGYGAGTLGNVERYTLRRERPTNLVLALGADGLTVVVQDAASIDEYGLNERVLSLTDVSDLATLTSHAQAALTSADDAVAIEVKLPTPASGGPLVPMLGRHFDVGDTLPIVLPEGKWEGVVTEATVEVDANGVSRMSGMTLVVGAAKARTYRRPAEAMIDVLREQERRIRNIETG